MLVAVLQDLGNLFSGFWSEDQFGLAAIFANPVGVEGFDVICGILGEVVYDCRFRVEDIFEVLNLLVGQLGKARVAFERRIAVLVVRMIDSLAQMGFGRMQYVSDVNLTPGLGDVLCFGSVPAATVVPCHLV